MKKIIIFAGIIFLLLFTINAQAGQVAGSKGNLNPGIAPPHSMASGMSQSDMLVDYVEAWCSNSQEVGCDLNYDGSFATGNTGKNGKVMLLPIDPGPDFEIEAKPGIKFFLPVATYLGFHEEDYLPDEWFGDVNHIFAEVTLNGESIMEPNIDYYINPQLLESPCELLYRPYGCFEIALVQGLAVLINPLPPGEHVITVHAEFVDFGISYDNTWIIRVGKTE